MAYSLRMKDASRESGLSVRQLYKLIAEGKLKSVTVGRRRLIPVKSLIYLVTHGLPPASPGEGGAKKKRAKA